MYNNPTVVFVDRGGSPSFQGKPTEKSNESWSSEELPNPTDLPSDLSIDLPYDLPNSWGEKQHATRLRGVAMERDSKRELNLKVWKNWRFQVGILGIEYAWGIHPTKNIWMTMGIEWLLCRQDSFVLLMFTYYII